MCHDDLKDVALDDILMDEEDFLNSSGSSSSSYEGGSVSSSSSSSSKRNRNGMGYRFGDAKMVSDYMKEARELWHDFLGLSLSPPLSLCVCLPEYFFM